ncbi:MAG: sigma-E processing peptidase SpoIIGA [Clostridia bacterium]|nr:sigma-E processing peptidase SpoIIGA [Clostridia bacterium]
MIIYVDILFFTNFLMDTLLLATTALIAGRKVRPWRLLGAAAAGALFGCLLFFAALPAALLFLIKIAIPAGLILLAFPFERFSSYGRTALTFLAANLLFGGGMYAFYAFTDAGSHMRTANGIYYMDLPLWLLLLLSFGFYALARGFFHLLDQRKEKNYLHTLTVDGTDLLALLDTGNSLYDPISLLPVVLSEWDALPLPEELLRAVLHQDATALPVLLEQFPHLHLRLLPYTDATGARTLLYAYKPKELKIDGQERAALIALTLQSLSPDRRFQALLHRDWSNL